MSYINQFIALILVGWIGVFTQISTIHLGHGHDILPAKASMCTIDCEEQSHHSAGQACEWFMAKRLTDNDGINHFNVQASTEFESIQWTAQYFLPTASHNYVHWDRGPPVA